MPVQGFAKVSSDWLCFSAVAFKYPKEKHLPYNTHMHFVVYNKKYIYIVLCFYPISGTELLKPLEFPKSQWQTQGPWAESGPLPCFIWPSTLFLPSGSTKLLAPS